MKLSSWFVGDAINRVSTMRPFDEGYKDSLDETRFLLTGEIGFEIACSYLKTKTTKLFYYPDFRTTFLNLMRLAC